MQAMSLFGWNGSLQQRKKRTFSVEREPATRKETDVYVRLLIRPETDPLDREAKKKYFA